MRIFGRNWIWAATAGLALSGCSVLSPVKDSTEYFLIDTADYQPVTVEAVEDPKTVGLGRVRVARYLESPGITVRERGHAVNYSSRNRWAEPLEASIGRVLAEALSAESVVARVVETSFRGGFAPDYDLDVLVSRAEGVREENGASAVFRATWVLRSGADGEMVASGSVREDELLWDGQNFAQLAESLSAGVAELARQVAEAVGGS